LGKGSDRRRKKVKRKKNALQIRLGPAGKGRRMGTEIIGDTEYTRKKKHKKKEI